MNTVGLDNLCFLGSDLWPDQEVASDVATRGAAHADVRLACFGVDPTKYFCVFDVVFIVKLPFL